MHAPRRRTDPASHFGFLDEAEKRPKKGAKRSDDPLDLDDVWGS